MRNCATQIATRRRVTCPQRSASTAALATGSGVNSASPRVTVTVLGASVIELDTALTAATQVTMETCASMNAMW